LFIYGLILTNQTFFNQPYLALFLSLGSCPNYGVQSTGSLLRQYKKQAHQAGFRGIKVRTSNIPHYFGSKKKLVDFLKKAPTIPEFGEANDYGILKKFIKENQTRKGIGSNTSRFLLEMLKK